MNPLNDFRKGEDLAKRVYEALRNYQYWADTMFIITFDEHGGFYDHQPPSAKVPSGNDTRYANPNYSFAFNRLGVRVPAISVSAYTAKGTINGGTPDDPTTVFDHIFVLAMVEKPFGLKPLTKRDESANIRKVENKVASRGEAPPDG